MFILTPICTTIAIPPYWLMTYIGCFINGCLVSMQRGYLIVSTSHYCAFGYHLLHLIWCKNLWWLFILVFVYVVCPKFRLGYTPINLQKESIFHSKQLSIFLSNNEITVKDVKNTYYSMFLIHKTTSIFSFKPSIFL